MHYIGVEDGDDKASQIEDKDVHETHGSICLPKDQARAFYTFAFLRVKFRI